MAQEQLEKHEGQQLCPTCERRAQLKRRVAASVSYINKHVMPWLVPLLLAFLATTNVHC
jgi:hypothetical protein